MADEFAKGIPQKEIVHDIPDVSEPEIWEYAVQRHKARRAGEHLDLRLGDPGTGFAHSWSMRRWPSPGDKLLAVQQPTHTMDYMDFQGQLPEGYGAGLVSLDDRDKVEITNATPDKISFNVYRGKGPEEYSLVRMQDDKWLILNRTINRQRIPGLPQDKPNYKEKQPSEVDFDNDDEVMQAKIDGAHNLIIFPRFGRHPRVMSYRPGKRVETGVIEHTHKLPNYYKIPIPKKLKDTILRGETYAADSKGRAIRAADLGSLLNSSVWKSRANQEGRQTPLRTVLFDVVQHKGKDVSNLPYRDKLRILEEVVAEIPDFHLPRMAMTSDEKRKLFEEIRSGKVPETKEGVVTWPLSTSDRPTKYKFRPEHDVYIRGFFDATPGSKYEGNAIGGFFYSHTSRGPIVGRVGTGLSDELRRKMFQDPTKYVGAVARVSALDLYPMAGKEDELGALRAPAFKDWHLDKNDVEFLKSAMLNPFDDFIEYLIADLS